MITAAIRQFLLDRSDDEAFKPLSFKYSTDVYHDFTNGRHVREIWALWL
jgi:hypothetical protein